MKIKIFHYIKETGKISNKINQLLLISYFHQKIVISKEITLLYESKYNLERENKVLLLMINDDDNEKYHCFVVKSKSELYSSEWLRSKKE